VIAQTMSSVFCNQCGHLNPASSTFCSSCGAVLDLGPDRTITLAKVDPLLDGTGAGDDAVVTVADLADLPEGGATLIVRDGPQAGDRFDLVDTLTRLGRHPDSEIMLDDITVSRRHAEVRRQPDGTFAVTDPGSLNGTYVNNERVDSATLKQGDDLQIGKFHLVFFARPVVPK
jgi:pSer/pThr/pTyr-binding forkhead associated (FHA) protein